MPLCSKASSGPCGPPTPASRSTVRWHARAPSPAPETWCCCPPPAPRTTSSATSSTGERPSAPWSRRSRDPAPERAALAHAPGRARRAGAAGGGPGAAGSGAGARLAGAGDGLFGERGDGGREAGERLLRPRASAGGGGGGAGVGLVVMAAAVRLGYRRLARMAYPMLVLSIVLLVLVLLPGVGTVVGGARRWLRAPGVSLQPAEIAKFTWVVYLAYSLAKKR